MKDFYRWIKSLDVVPTIISLRKMFEEIKNEEVKEALSYLKGLSEEQISVIEKMADAIAKKILHNPVSHLKKEANRVEGDFYIEAARKLFDLDREEGQEIKEIKKG